MNTRIGYGLRSSVCLIVVLTVGGREEIPTPLLRWLGELSRGLGLRDCIGGMACKRAFLTASVS